jgi:hypothetical protein
MFCWYQKNSDDGTESWLVAAPGRKGVSTEATKRLYWPTNANPRVTLKLVLIVSPSFSISGLAGSWPIIRPPHCLNESQGIEIYALEV